MTKTTEENNQVCVITFCVCFTILCLAFAGDPDLMDAIIERIRSGV